MDDLTTFLRARLDEDEAAAPTTHNAGCVLFNDVPDCNCGIPRRMLREVEAKRAILDAYMKCAGTLAGDALLDGIRHLAAVYNGHPGSE